MIALPLLSAAVGAVIGSFTATAALRSTTPASPRGARSRCDWCGQRLSFVASTPIASFAVLRGRAACCGHAINPVHLVGEVAGAVIVAVAFSVLPPVDALAASGIGLLLLAISITDARTRRIPDALTLAVALCAVVWTWVEHRGWSGLVFAGAALVVLSVLRLAFEKVQGRPGLGGGDVKLIAALALWVGPLIIPAVGTAALLGLVAISCIKPKDSRLPFAPFLAGASWVVNLLSGSAA